MQCQRCGPIITSCRVSSPGAAVPAIRVSDTVKRVAPGAGGGTHQVVETIPREQVWLAQTPQGFDFEAILSAHRSFKGEAADDVEVARAAGIAVKIVEGCEQNLKLTFPGDFARAEAFLKGR